MWYVHTFQTDGHHKLGSFNSLVIKDLKTLRGVRARIEKTCWLDTRLGYEIVWVSANNPYADGEVVFRSVRARQLFGNP